MDSSRLNNDLAKAVDLFVMKKFKDCFNECKDIIASAKMEAEQKRNDEIIEAATALGIQALAETDCWLDTTAFVTNVYGNVDIWPPRVIQVCILLHAHVREYLPCHSMVQSWLKNQQNLSLKQCGQVIRVYAAHVLCPTGCQEMVKEIIDKCVSLTHTERATLLEQSLSQSQEADCKLFTTTSTSCCPKPSQNERCNTNPPYIRHRLESFLHSASKTSFDEDEMEQKINHQKIDDPVSWIQTTALLGYEKVCCFFTERLRFLSNPGMKLFLMGTMAMLALMHTQKGDVVSSLGRFVILWRTFIGKLFDYIKFKSK